MSFYIQASNPAFLNAAESYDDSLKEVIEAIFPYEAENAYLVWNGFPIKMQYKYDVSMIMEAVLALLEILLSSSNIPGIPIDIDCFSFSTSWYVRCLEDSISITSKWQRIEAGYEDVLNSDNQLEIKKDDFMKEWKMLLRKVIEAIEQSNIKADKKSLRRLYDIEKAIPKFGIRYKLFPLDSESDRARISPHSQAITANFKYLNY
jgi:hypothetical protein